MRRRYDGLRSVGGSGASVLDLAVRGDGAGAVGPSTKTSIRKARCVKRRRCKAYERVSSSWAAAEAAAAAAARVGVESSDSWGARVSRMKGIVGILVVDVDWEKCACC